MDHSEAVAAGMVERYVLGELSGPERDQFEEHYFSCGPCAAGLRAALAVKEAVRSVGGSDWPRRVTNVQASSSGPARKSATSGINRQWGAWAALTVVSIGAGYQGFVQMPRLRSAVAQLQQPRLFTGSTVLRMGNRAVQPVTSELHAGQPLHFFLEIPIEAQFEEYEVRITPPEGDAPVTRVPADQARDSVLLVIPKAVSGIYRIAVLGKGREGEPRLLEETEIRIQ